MSIETVNRKYKNNVKRLLMFYGLYPHQRGKMKHLSIVMLVFCFYIFCVMVNFVRIHITNISAIIACFSLLTTVIQVTIKVLQFRFHREKLTHIYDTLESLFEETAMKQPPSSPVFQYMVPCYRLFCYQFFSFVSTAVLYALKPLIDIAVRHANRKMPLPTAYPWPIVSTTSFTAHYLFEAYISVSLAIITPGVDAFFALCSVRVCSVFRAMAIELEESPKKPNHVENREILLRKCIERHAALIECRDSLQEIYGPVVLSVTVINGLGMCALIFEVLRAEEIPLEKYIALSLYLTGKIAQTLSFAWPGDMITFENEVFRHEVYCSDWYEESNTRIAKLSLTILSQRLMVLKAYNFLVISLNLFATIMNRTISYYFLLVTLDDAD